MNTICNYSHLSAFSVSVLSSSSLSSFSLFSHFFHFFNLCISKYNIHQKIIQQRYLPSYHIYYNNPVGTIITNTVLTPYLIPRHHTLATTYSTTATIQFWSTKATLYHQLPPLPHTRTHLAPLGSGLSQDKLVYRAHDLLIGPTVI